MGGAAFTLLHGASREVAGAALVAIACAVALAIISAVVARGRR